MLLLAYPPRCWFYKQSTTHSEWIQSPRWIPQHEIEGFSGGSNQSESVTIPASLLAVWICDPVPHEIHCAASLHNVCRSLTCRWSPKLRLEFKNILKKQCPIYKTIQILNMSPSFFKFVAFNNLGAARQAARWPQAIALLQPDSEIQGWATYPGKAWNILGCWWT